MNSNDGFDAHVDSLLARLVELQTRQQVAKMLTDYWLARRDDSLDKLAIWKQEPRNKRNDAEVDRWGNEFRRANVIHAQSRRMWERQLKLLKTAQVELESALSSAKPEKPEL